MNSGSKIAAFTLVDVLTGMIITSIIIAMVFYIFTALNKQVFDYGNTRNQINAFLLLKSDLRQKFESKDAVVFGVPGGLEVVQENGSITYLKEGTILLRKSEYSMDTLTTFLNGMDMTFTKDSEGNLTENIQDLQLDLAFGTQELTCRFHKDYGHVGAINQKLLHVY